MEELKKVYRIGDTIEAEELEEVSKGIAKKALKVIEASGNRFATNIIEGRDADTFADLVQSVAVALIENNYIISKECYKIVNHYLYNYKKSQLILHIDNEDEKNEIERNGYIEYITTNYTQKTSQKSNITSLKNIYNMLTPRQAEILKIYTNLGNIQHTADFLGISRQAIQNALHDIKQKLSYCIA